MLARSEYIYSIQPRYKFKRRNKKKRNNLRAFSATAVPVIQFRNANGRNKRLNTMHKSVYTHTSYCSIHVPFSEGLCSLHHFRTHVVFRLRNNNNMILLPSMSHGKRSLWKRLSTVGGALTVPNWLTHLFRLFQVIIVIGFLRILHFLVHLHTAACIIHLNIKYRNIMMRSECSSFFFQNLEFKYRWKKGVSRNLTFSFISTLSFYRFYS